MAHPVHVYDWFTMSLLMSCLPLFNHLPLWTLHPRAFQIYLVKRRLDIDLQRRGKLIIAILYSLYIENKNLQLDWKTQKSFSVKRMQATEARFGEMYFIYLIIWQVQADTDAHSQGRRYRRPWPLVFTQAGATSDFGTKSEGENSSVFVQFCHQSCFLRLKICTKSFVGWGFTADHTGGAYSAHQTL